PKLPATDRVDTRHAALGTPDMQLPGPPVDVVPPKRHKFTGTQPMAIGDQDRGRVAMTPPIVSGSLDQLLDLALGQVFPRSGRADCYIYSRRSSPRGLRNFHGFCPSARLTVTIIARTETVSQSQNRPSCARR